MNFVRNRSISGHPYSWKIKKNESTDEAATNSVPVLLDCQDLEIQDPSSERSFSSEHDCFSKCGSSLRKSIEIVHSVRESIQRGIKSLQIFLDIHRGSDWPTNALHRRKVILDPQGSFLQKWNYRLAISCMFALLFDTLFFYIPVIDSKKMCLDWDNCLAITACVLRSFTDILYMLHICIQFRTGFTAPSAAYGSGRLIVDSYAIAKRYLSSYFIVDFLSVLPIPQVATLVILPKRKGPIRPVINDWLTYALSFQCFPRLFRIYPLYKETANASGILVETAWGGAALNLISYMLASNAIGAFWYYFSIEQKGRCLLAACDFSYCGGKYRGNCTSLDGLCPLFEPDDIRNSTYFDFGIYFDALQSRVVETRVFPKKILYCFWWGLRSLSSLGQNLRTSTDVWEILFTVIICIVGLLLFAFLIGNLQKYLQSLTVRVEEQRVKRQDAEEWMSHRMLPEYLKERIRRYEQYRWQETKGVEEESVMHNLPNDIRIEVKRHLCLDLVRRVPIFGMVDETFLDAICDSLKQVLYTPESFVVRQGDPVNGMLFIVRGTLLRVITDKRSTGLFYPNYLREGDFCGEELLMWALNPHNSFSRLPTSTATVRTLTDVAAYSLTADDLRSVVTQNRQVLRNKKIQCTYRFYSHQWRTWAACFIQAAWRRLCRRKRVNTLREEEDRLQDALAKEVRTSLSLGGTIYASRFVANIRKTIQGNTSRYAKLPQTLPHLLLQKPTEPYFTAENP